MCYYPALLMTLVLMACCLMAWANPILVTHPAYISAEQLVVKVGAEAAEIDGRFHFKSMADKKDPVWGASVMFEIPIWVPSDAKYADARTAALLRSCKASDMNRLEGGQRAVWDAAVGLKVSVGRHELKIEDFLVFDPGSKSDMQWVPGAWMRKGYYCLVVRLFFKPDWLRGDPEIRVQYRQGLRLTREGGEFHYVPEFDRMPEKMTTGDLGRYAMHVTNASAGTMTLGTVSVPAGSGAVLPLAQHVPVGFVVRKTGK